MRHTLWKMFSPKSRACSGEAAPGSHCFHRLRLHRFISVHRKPNRMACFLRAMLLVLSILSRATGFLWPCRAERWSRNPLFLFCVGAVHSTKHISSIVRHTVSDLRRHFATQLAFVAHWPPPNGFAALLWHLWACLELERCW